MLYRIHSNLNIGDRRRVSKGRLDSLKDISEAARETLLGKGVISMVKTPPLEVLKQKLEDAKVEVEVEEEDLFELYENGVLEVEDHLVTAKSYSSTVSNVEGSAAFDVEEVPDQPDQLNLEDSETQEGE